MQLSPPSGASITLASRSKDLDTVMSFFISLGFETEGRTALEGEFLDTVIGIPNSRTEIVTLRPAQRRNWAGTVELHPSRARTGSPEAMANELGLRSVVFEVDDLQSILDRLVAGGYHTVGGVGRYEAFWRMAYVRGPEGIIVALAERTD